jgi:hypothetical protein
MTLPARGDAVRVLCAGVEQGELLFYATVASYSVLMLLLSCLVFYNSTFQSLFEE